MLKWVPDPVEVNSEPHWSWFLSLPNRVTGHAKVGSWPCQSGFLSTPKWVPASSEVLSWSNKIVFLTLLTLIPDTSQVVCWPHQSLFLTLPHWVPDPQKGSLTRKKKVSHSIKVDSLPCQIEAVVPMDGTGQDGSRVEYNTCVISICPILVWELKPVPEDSIFVYQ